MYFNDVNIIYYIILAIIGLFVGELVNWANKRLPEEKKVISLDIFREYKKNFSPNYLLMIITAILYIAILYKFGIKSTFIENLNLIKYLILTPMLISVVVIDFKYQIIPNRLNLSMFESGLIFVFLYGMSNVAISINMIIGMLVRRRNFFRNYSFRWVSLWKRSNGTWRRKINGCSWSIFWFKQYNNCISSFIFSRSNFKYTFINH